MNEFAVADLIGELADWLREHPEQGEQPQPGEDASNG